MLSIRAPRAHPRSRGENATNEDPASAYSGSSPLTRGKQQNRDATSVPPRLIPAHAGKTCPAWLVPSTAWAHPRSRGENTEADEDSRALWGSSPLTRGKHGVYFPSDDPVRLIPAHAGKTPPPRRPGWTRPAHPRSRGENRVQSPEPDQRRGSSPLTRGKLRHPVYQLPRVGLIPAHAGKTAA